MLRGLQSTTACMHASAGISDELRVPKCPYNNMCCVKYILMHVYIYVDPIFMFLSVHHVSIVAAELVVSEKIAC